jgi:hypothetical protein
MRRIGSSLISQRLATTAISTSTRASARAATLRSTHSVRAPSPNHTYLTQLINAWSTTRGSDELAHNPPLILSLS